MTRTEMAKRIVRDVPLWPFQLLAAIILAGLLIGAAASPEIAQSAEDPLWPIVVVMLAVIAMGPVIARSITIRVR